MTRRDKWIASTTNCPQRGRSGSPVLSGAHLEQKAHSTVGKAPLGVEIHDSAMVIWENAAGYVKADLSLIFLFAVTTVRGCLMFGFTSVAFFAELQTFPTRTSHLLFGSCGSRGTL